MCKKYLATILFLCGFGANLANAAGEKELLDAKTMCEEMQKLLKLAEMTPECVDLLQSLAKAVLGSQNPQVEKLSVEALTSIQDTIEEKQRVWGETCPANAPQIEELAKKIEENPRVRKRDKIKGFFKKCAGRT